MGAVFAVVASVVIGSAIFGMSIWVYVPTEKSPFAHGIGSGMAKCTVFSAAVWLVLIGLIMVLSIIGFLIWIVLFFIGMKRVFECGIFDTIIIIIINFVISYGIGLLVNYLS